MAIPLNAFWWVMWFLPQVVPVMQFYLFEFGCGVSAVSGPEFIAVCGLLLIEYTVSDKWSVLSVGVVEGAPLILLRIFVGVGVVFS